MTEFANQTEIFNGVDRFDAQAVRPAIHRHNGQWFMFMGDEASPMDAVISAMLNAKLARMTEAQRSKPQPSLLDVETLDREAWP